MVHKRYVNGELVEHLIDGVPQAVENPNSFAIAKSVIGAISSVVRHGAKKVSDEERARRLAICNSCEFLIRGKSDRCSKCGCHLKWKTTLEAWHCPIGKW